MSVPSSELGPSTPSLASKCGSPPGPKWEGGTHSFVGEGVEGPNSDDVTEIVVLYVYYNPSTVISMCIRAFYNYFCT
jgi:hypothetical protein